MPHASAEARKQYAQAYYKQHAEDIKRRVAACKNSLQVCQTCRTAFSAHTGDVNRGRAIYCSRECRPVWNSGILGRQPWMNTSGLNSHGEHKGIDTEFKVGCAGFTKKHSEATKRKISQNQQQGAEWSGFITPESKLERHRFAKTMRHLVFKRDGYRCVMCGAGGCLQVDHILSWSTNPELRFDLSNCRTLCNKCHYFMTFGREMPPNIKAWGHNLDMVA